MDITPKAKTRIEPTQKEDIFTKALPPKEAKLNDYWEQYKNQFLEFLKSSTSFGFKNTSWKELRISKATFLAPLDALLSPP
ncbi:hypothetical protein [Thermococcus sp. PK]|uniref:hypothetical protein n=1 Tax=Thermococcus sp. PK TaxID=913025 RepID=UPI0005B28C09|nr:hypothetical protein [Thermococcus sp. PK]